MGKLKIYVKNMLIYTKNIVVWKKRDYSFHILTGCSERTQRCLTDCPWPFPGAYINEAK